MTRLILYAGANGAGKSTLRAEAADPVEIEIDPDRIAREMEPSSPRSVDVAAGKEALRRFEQALAEGKTLSLESTLTGRTVLGRMRSARTAGYDVTLRYVALTDVEQHIRRVQARVTEGGHWIDEATIRRRVVANLDNLAEAIALADLALIFDNSGASHRLILSIEHGVTTYLSPTPPPWLAERLARIGAALGQTDRTSR